MIEFYREIIVSLITFATTIVGFWLRGKSKRNKENSSVFLDFFKENEISEMTIRCTFEGKKINYISKGALPRQCSLFSSSGLISADVSSKKQLNEKEKQKATYLLNKIENKKI